MFLLTNFIGKIWKTLEFHGIDPCMKYSELFCPTLKEVPQGVEVISHKLMLRAGMIRQVAAGIYDILPLGLRVQRKVENIVREEMNRAGAQELFLPIVAPAELWKETNRWETNGKELLRIKDRHNRDFCLGPTHEEVITDLVRREIRSYKELPKTLYQIQVKFRDEIRPRFGLMRGREFIMKDAYSFDATDEGVDKSYKAMSKAYHAIFKRCGLKFRSVEADSGNIGGAMSEEFMVLADSGEDRIVYCPSCGYAANSEKADSTMNLKNLPKEKFSQLAKEHTPDQKTIADVGNFLQVPVQETLKTMIYKTEKDYVAVVLPGDYEINEVAIAKIPGSGIERMATQEEVEKITSIPFGSIGPIDLMTKIPAIKKIYFDTMVQKDRRYVVGANEKDYHYTGAKAGSDFSIQDVASFHIVKEGDICVSCKKNELEVLRGIEVGHVFKLGTKYSEKMKAMFLDHQGKQKPFIMGCYGIGIGRTVAASIEQNNDDRGVIFPPAIAPFDMVIVPVKFKDEAIKAATIKLYEEMKSKGLDVLIDDRDNSFGSKLTDADLLGIPIRVIVGAKTVEENTVEFKPRWVPDVSVIKTEQLYDQTKQILEKGF